MITLVMEEVDGLQRPLELKIGDRVFEYRYTNETPDESFFELLEDYINYKIKVDFKSKGGIFSKTGIIRAIKPNKKVFWGLYSMI